MAQRTQNIHGSDNLSAASTSPVSRPKTDGPVQANGIMTSSNLTSKSSLPSLKDAVLSESASPYGTRSRNRTGQTRPNYAEDRDIDSDLYDIPEKKESAPKKVSRHSAPAPAPASNGADFSSAATGANPSVLGGPGNTAPGPGASSQHQQHQDPNSKQNVRKRASPEARSATNGAKDAGSSSHATTPNSTGTPSQPSKKRKTNNHSTKDSPVSAPNVQSQLAAQYISANNDVIEKCKTGYRETNLLTFETCGGHPRDRKLTADDGTVLEINGMCGPSHGADGLTGRLGWSSGHKFPALHESRSGHCKRETKRERKKKKKKKPK